MSGISELTAGLTADTAIRLAGPMALQASFDDLYTATYAILDDAKGDHDLIKLYKGSHGSANPHPIVSDFGQFFFQQRRGPIAYACQTVNPHRPAQLTDLDIFDREHAPRVSVRTVFDLLADTVRRPRESDADVLHYATSRTHCLGAYRGGSSGYDDEARAFAAAHFRQTGMAVTPGQVLVFCGGAKGAFLAFCAALMCRRRHDDLRHLGGLLLTPAGYYQSLRLIPPLFGGGIHVVDQLTGQTVRDWLADTRDQPCRCVYVPLVNNADGRVLTAERAYEIAHAVLEHNTAHTDRAVYVLGDDVYAGSYLTSGIDGLPIGAVTGTDLGEPALGRMSDWTLSVVTASKTFALPTARVAFAATSNPALRAAVGHYRTVLSQGRVPQMTELPAAAAICFTPQAWIDDWNSRYRTVLDDLISRIEAINTGAGFRAFHIEPPEGGWYMPMRISRRLIPAAASSVDAFAVLLHHGGADRDSGIAMLPGELFGHRNYTGGFLLRGTLAAGEGQLARFTDRLRAAAARLTGPDGLAIAERALSRARAITDIDTILANSRY